MHVECCSVEPLSVEPGSDKDVEATWMTGAEVDLLMLSPLHLADHIFDVAVAFQSVPSCRSGNGDCIRESV